MNESLLVKECREIFGDMRDSTREERNSIQRYIDSISENTGINFWEILEKEKEKLK